ncbi:hypothetical protein KEG38_20435 [Polyangium jinanense]|uniref:hypothetical protein n=1 Tax=Polyangium jinanense TaxID=2829994 RepID=UPI002340E43E|nr:hypothetical protein [Polyangium jinanense]MDC3956241.1 hypothetical protein [Polyangium jinanense]
MAARDNELLDEIRAVLANAAKGKGPVPQFLTSFQILNRLPATTREWLITEYGRPGEGAKAHFAAASAIAASLKKLGGEVDVMYIDARGVSFDVGGEQVRSGYPLCGLYRLRQTEPEIT